MQTEQEYCAELDKKLEIETRLIAAKKEQFARLCPIAFKLQEALSALTPDAIDVSAGGWDQGSGSIYSYGSIEIHFDERDSWADAEEVFKTLEYLDFVLEDWESTNVPATLTRVYTHGDVKIYWQLRSNNSSGCYKRHVRREVHTNSYEQDVWEIVCPSEEKTA